MSALGKFEGDPFEQLYIKIDPDTNKLHVIVEQGQEAEFDLAKKSYVFEDSQDPTSFILDYHKMIVVFKVLGLLLSCAPTLCLIQLSVSHCRWIQ